jgi:hypothetical protein
MKLWKCDSCDKQFLNFKFIFTIFFLLVFWLALTFSIVQFKERKFVEKNLEIERLLRSGVENYFEQFWVYPESLQKLEDENLLNPLDLVLNSSNKSCFLYNSSGDSFELNFVRGVVCED